MPTLKDVAKLACVDVSTVSRALNNNPCVHAETKARIMAAVEKLSYRPNLLAKGLRQGKRHTYCIEHKALQDDAHNVETHGGSRHLRQNEE